MVRALLAVIIVALAGCAHVNEPNFSYDFVVDGQVGRKLPVPKGTDEIAVVVQPRNGDSAIWQNYGATRAYVELELYEGDMTPSGGREIELGGLVTYYRDLKVEQEEGMDVIVRGRAIDDEDVEYTTVVVEPGVPKVVRLVDGVEVAISIVPTTVSNAAR